MKKFIAISLFLLFVFPVQSGAMKWKTISAEDSLLTVKIRDLKTRYYGSGWNENYSMQHFMALANARWVSGPESGEDLRPFYLFAHMIEIARGYQWTSMSHNLLQRIKKTPSFKDRNVQVLDQFNIDIKHAADTKHGLGQSLKFSADEWAHRGPEICYMFFYGRGIDNAGLWGGCVDWCPALTLRICASKDLNLDMSEPPKYFRIDTDNEKASLNLSHSNLGKKLLDLSNSTYNDLVR